MRLPTFIEAISPIIFLIILLSITVAIFGDESLDGSSQIVLILSSAVASLVAIRIGFSWNELQKGIVKSIGNMEFTTELYQ